MSNKELGFVFKKELCIQCHACESACKNWHHTGPGVKWRRIAHRWQGSYPFVSGYTLSLACMHCLNPECTRVCPAGAIKKHPDTGAVLVEPSKCIGCGRCLKACPVKAPQFGADGRMQKCDLCYGDPAVFDTSEPPCIRACPTQALSLQWRTPQEKADDERQMTDLAKD